MACWRDKERTLLYQIYVTDMLKTLCENAAASARHDGGDGFYIKTRFSDLLYPKPVETRTGEEIIDHMKHLLGGMEASG